MVWEDPSHPRRLVEWLPACGCTWGADFNPATTSTWNNSRRAVRSPTVITRLIKFNEAVHLRVFFFRTFRCDPHPLDVADNWKIDKTLRFCLFFFFCAATRGPSWSVGRSEITRWRADHSGIAAQSTTSHPAHRQRSLRHRLHGRGRQRSGVQRCTGHPTPPGGR